MAYFEARRPEPSAVLLPLDAFEIPIWLRRIYRGMRPLAFLMAASLNDIFWWRAALMTYLFSLLLSRQLDCESVCDSLDHHHQVITVMQFPPSEEIRATPAIGCYCSCCHYDSIGSFIAVGGFSSHRSLGSFRLIWHWPQSLTVFIRSAHKRIGGHVPTTLSSVLLILVLFFKIIIITIIIIFF